MLRYSSRWELLVAVMLSAQCTDKKVNEVTVRLFKKYRRIDDYIRAPLSRLERDIYSTGFYRTKARHIRAAARIIKDQFGGEIPKTMSGLLELPGVARKTANVVLGNAYGIVEGIAVDTHVKRLSRRLGLSNQKNPARIEQELMKLFPKKQWFELTYLLIEYGRAYCKASTRNHTKCPLSYFEHLS